MNAVLSMSDEAEIRAFEALLELACWRRRYALMDVLYYEMKAYGLNVRSGSELSRRLNIACTCRKLNRATSFRDWLEALRGVLDALDASGRSPWMDARTLRETCRLRRACGLIGVREAVENGVDLDASLAQAFVCERPQDAAYAARLTQEREALAAAVASPAGRIGHLAIVADVLESNWEPLRLEMRAVADQATALLAHVETALPAPLLVPTLDALVDSRPNSDVFRERPAGSALPQFHDDEPSPVKDVDDDKERHADDEAPREHEAEVALEDEDDEIDEPLPRRKRRRDQAGGKPRHKATATVEYCHDNELPPRRRARAAIDCYDDEDDALAKRNAKYNYVYDGEPYVRRKSKAAFGYYEEDEPPQRRKAKADFEYYDDDEPSPRRKAAFRDYEDYEVPRPLRHTPAVSHEVEMRRPRRKAPAVFDDYDSPSMKRRLYNERRPRSTLDEDNAWPRTRHARPWGLAERPRRRRESLIDSEEEEERVSHRKAWDEEEEFPIPRRRRAMKHADIDEELMRRRQRSTEDEIRRTREDDNSYTRAGDNEKLRSRKSRRMEEGRRSNVIFEEEEDSSRSLHPALVERAATERNRIVGKHGRPTRVRRRWTPDEERELADLMKTYGNQWALILKSSKLFQSHGRTAVDLKDKARNMLKKQLPTVSPRNDDDDDEDDDDNHTIDVDAFASSVEGWCRRALVLDSDSKVHVSTVRDAYCKANPPAPAVSSELKNPKSGLSQQFRKILLSIVGEDCYSKSCVIGGVNQIGLIGCRLCAALDDVGGDEHDDGQSAMMAPAANVSATGDEPSDQYDNAPTPAPTPLCDTGV